MALTDRERQQIRDLLRTTPLSFKWSQGTRLPEVSTKEMVFFENEEQKSMRVGVRRGQNTYWLFTGQIADDDDQDAIGNINLIRHAKRHVTATYASTEDTQTGVDPITAYKFTWTGEHTFTPAAVDRVPITINAMTAHTANLVAIVNRDAAASTTINAESQHALNAAAQTGILNVKAGTGSIIPTDYTSLEAWYDGSLETGSDGSSLTTVTDRSGNGHTITGYGTVGVPTVVADLQNSLPGFSTDLTNVTYFRQSTAFDLTDSFTLIWIGKNTRATNWPVFIGNTDHYTEQNIDSIASWKRNTLSSSPSEPWTTGVPKWSMAGAASQTAASTISAYWLAPVSGSHAGNIYVHTIVVTRAAADDWQMTSYRFNGVEKAGTPAVLNPSSDSFQIDHTLGYGMDTCEMMLFNEALSASDLTDLENYLANKWQFESAGTQDTNLDKDSVTGALDILSGEDTDGDRRVHIDTDGKLGLDGAATVALNPGARLHVRDETTPQVKIDYDTSNALQISVASDGDVSLTATTDFTLTPGTNADLILQSDSGSLVYVKDDRVGIGTAAPEVKLHIKHTDINLRLEYDASNYTNFTPKADGTLHINPVGAASHVYIGDSYTDISQDKGLIVNPHIYAQAPDTVTLFGFMIGTAEKANIRYYDATDDLRFTDGAAAVRFMIGDNVVTIGPDNADTKTLTFAHTTADGTITYNGTAWTFSPLLDHGALAGLGDDDHTQYILVDGTRAFTGIQTGVAPTGYPSEELVTVNYLTEFFVLYGQPLTAGAGLTGGGTLVNADTVLATGYPDITFDIVVPDKGGLNVNANDVELDLDNLNSTVEVLVSGDSFAYYDASQAETLKISWGTLMGEIDHGSIAGLSDNDHNQYLLTDCSNDPLTGDLELEQSLTFNEITPPGTPSANKSVVYLDSTVEELVTKKDTGHVHNLERSMNVFSAYVDIKARNKVFNVNGNFANLVTAGSVSSGSPQAAAVGTGKLVIVVNAGADTAGTLTVTGTKVDRDDGTETGSFADDLTIAGTTTDTTAADAAGNNVWGFENAYVTSAWFTGTVSISTTDLDLSDIDVYQVAFEQFNDGPDTTIETMDITAYANNASAWYYAHGYKISVSGDTCTIAAIINIEWPATKVTANTPYRWRRSAGVVVDGATDGIWGEHFFGPLASTYWEDINLKLWFSQPMEE